MFSHIVLISYRFTVTIDDANTAIWHHYLNVQAQQPTPQEAGEQRAAR